MNKIFTNEQFDQCTKAATFLLAYFSGETCNVCHSLKPKIEQLVVQQFPRVELIEIPTEKAPELSARFSVFSVPVILFYVEGREYIREARIVSVTDLAQKMDKIIALYEE